MCPCWNKQVSSWKAGAGDTGADAADTAWSTGVQHTRVFSSVFSSGLTESFFFSSQTQQRSGREKPEDGEQGATAALREEDAAFLPPFLSPRASGPPVLQVYQPRLKTVKCSKRAGERSDELPASEAQRLLQQAKTRLWSRKQRRRLAARMQIQDLADELDGLVMIPP